jgi:HAD superfamily hydrolase (TIGR01549 family)
MKIEKPAGRCKYVKIKAVILDFGGTLSEGDLDGDPYHLAIQGIITRRGYPVEMRDLKKAIRGALQNLDKVRNRGRERTFEEVYTDFLGNLGVPADEELLEELHASFRTHYRTEYLPCTEDVLRELSSKYKVALLSNTMSDHPRVLLRESGYDKYFTFILCSRDVGVRKPNPEVFRIVLDRLGVKPEEAVHVGDRVDVDMYGARDAGITGIWVKKPDELPWSGYAIGSICELPTLLRRMKV